MKHYFLICKLIASILLLFVFPLHAKPLPPTKPRAQEWQINGINAAFQDQIPGVHAIAVEYLADHSELSWESLKPESWRKIIQRLEDPDENVRRAAAETLGGMGDKIPEAGVKVLTNRLADKNEDVSWAAAETLSGMVDKLPETALKELIESLKHSDIYVCRAAARALGGMRDKIPGQAIKTLADRLNHADVYDRYTTLMALAGGRDRLNASTLNELLHRLGDKNEDARWVVAWALLGVETKIPKQTIITLIDRLENKDEDLQWAALEMLIRVEDKIPKPTVQSLIALLEHQDPFVNWAAAMVFHEMRDEIPGRVAKAFIDLIESSSTYGPWAAGLALQRVGGKLPESAVKALTDRLTNADKKIRRAAAQALGGMGNEMPESAMKALIDRLMDASEGVGQAAAAALGGMREKIPEAAVKALIDSLADANESVRWEAAKALSKVAQPPLLDKQLPSLLKPAYFNNFLAAEYRFYAHLLTGATHKVETLLRWLGEPGKNKPENLTKNQAKQTLSAFAALHQIVSDYPKIRDDLAKQTADIISQRKITWTPDDLPTLQTHLNWLETNAPTQAESVRKTMADVVALSWAQLASKIWLIHLLFWITLILLYPRSRIVQAIFFWNPYVRKILGFGYVNLALTWVPYLRRLLMSPFQEVLMSEAHLDEFRQQPYFSESKVELNRKTHPLFDALPELKGQVVLEGESGLGKTMALRALLTRSRHTAVYLPAERCAGGVMTAIQQKLLGMVRDEAYLQNLIYSGALDIYVDGLNEVSADTRAGLNQFAEKYFKANLMIATQPLDAWNPPAGARCCRLLPLERDQIAAFLDGCWPLVEAESALTEAAYRGNVRDFLARALKPDQDADSMKAVLKVLSNPMDLTVCAHMLGRGEQPDLFRLQEQQYEQMAVEYRRTHVGKPFPLKKFAGAVYQMRLNDQVELPVQDFYEEIIAMESFKMVLRRNREDAEGKPVKTWQFRHDKIMDYFIVQAFLAENNPHPEHIPDPRFRGVYFLLADLLPLDEARKLREDLIRYAADSKDHQVSDTFVQMLFAREQREAPEGGE